MKIDESELIREYLFHFFQHLAIIREIPAGRLVSDVYSPDGWMVLEFCCPLLIDRKRMDIFQGAGVVSHAAPPTRNNTAEYGTQTIFLEKVQCRTVVVHADDEIYAAVGQILDVGLSAGIRTEVIDSNVHPATVHPSGLCRVAILVLCGKVSRGSCSGHSGREQD